jgi:hypothetical protein
MLSAGAKRDALTGFYEIISELTAEGNYALANALEHYKLLSRHHPHRQRARAEAEHKLAVPRLPQRRRRRHPAANVGVDLRLVGDVLHLCSYVCE